MSETRGKFEELLAATKETERRSNMNKRKAQNILNLTNLSRIKAYVAENPDEIFTTCNGFHCLVAKYLKNKLKADGAFVNTLEFRLGFGAKAIDGCVPKRIAKIIHKFDNHWVRTERVQGNDLLRDWDRIFSEEN